MRVLRKREELIIMTKQRQIDLSHSKFNYPKKESGLNYQRSIKVTKT
jgi:hypothetical protein